MLTIMGPMHEVLQDDFEDEPYSEEEPVMSDIEEAGIQHLLRCLTLSRHLCKASGLHGPGCRQGW